MRGRLPGNGTLVGLIVLGALLAPAVAQAEITSVFGGDVPCTEQGDGVRFCSDSPRSTTAAFDGVPIDVNVAFPPVPASGPDGDFPLVMMFHGYGGEKFGLEDMQRWLDKGYATFSMSDRGFHESCGSPASQVAAMGACTDGYIRLIDNRYEVRDAQEFAGELADELAADAGTGDPGLVDPQGIAAIGGSYGGGMSMALGALKDRKVLEDYRLVPWTSPAGKPMRIAAAAPTIPWTDLAASLAPNGSTLDYVEDAPYKGRPGVEKQSFVTGLYASGLIAPGFYAPPGTDPNADLTPWLATLEAGEPYGDDIDAIINEITQHHSSYYIDHSIEPAPMLMSSGFTDDLFPVDETIRYYNRTKAQYPNADLSLFFGDFGHQRGQNKDDVSDALDADEEAWFDYYVKGEGSEPEQGVTAYTETCPADAPSGGPYEAANWAEMAPGEIRADFDKKVTIDPASTTGGQFNPITESDACATHDATDPEGAAVYDLGKAPKPGYTLMGAVSVIAKFTLPGDTSQVAARLLDVDPDGQATLVDRGLWRPATGGPKKQVFQLHPNGYRFAPGHEPKLELIASDAGATGAQSYGRKSNDQQPVDVSDLEVRMPVVEKPGALHGLVGAPAPKFVPAGYELAPDFAKLGAPSAELVGKTLKVKGRRLIAKVLCPGEFAACNDVVVAVKSKKSRGGKGAPKSAKSSFKVAGGSIDRIDGGAKRKLKLKLTSKGRNYFKRRSKLNVKTKVTTAENVRPTKGRARAVGKKHKRRGHGGR